MITFEALRSEVPVQEEELRRWIDEAWIKPERQGDEPVFREIDVARVRLIVELRQEMSVGDEAVPVVLSLLDQLYAARRQMRLLCEAIDRAGSETLRRSIAAQLGHDLED